MGELRRLFPYLARYRGAYAVGVVILVCSSLTAMAGPLLLREAIDSLEAGSTREFLAWASAGIVAIALVRGMFSFFGRRQLVATSRSIEYDIRNDLFRHLQRLGPSYYARHPAGDVSSRVINDLDGVRMLVGIGLMAFLSTIVTGVLGIAMMFVLEARLAALAAAPLLGIAAVFAVTQRALHRRSVAVQDQLGLLSALAQENFSGQRVVRAYGQEEPEVRRFDGASAGYRDRQMAVVRLRGLTWAFLAVFAEGGIVLTLWLGGRGIIEGTFSRGDLLAFTAYQFMLVWPMIALGWFVGMLQRGAACAQRLGEILDVRPEIDDPTGDGAPLPDPPAIVVRNLTFSYGGAPVLENVSLSIPPGALVAVVGRTGSGKSTLAGLLTRILPTPAGTVFVGGRDLVTVPAEELRARVASVPQDDFLFSDTVTANISFGARNGAAAEDVVRAAEVSMLVRDIEGFPKRYEEVVGERGVILSGGQKQRTCLARAVIRSPSVLVLDDCFSHVDVETEAEILRRLREYLRGRTCVMITHRLLGCRAADRIYVIDRGRVVEEGLHEDLVRGEGLYARLWAHQRLTEELERL